MNTDQSGTYNRLQESHEESLQEGGPITGMLKGTVSSLGDNLRSIVRGEVSLAKRELKQEATQVGRAGGMIAGSGVLGLNGFMFLMWGLVFLLTKKLPLWASASVVGSALVTLAGILGTVGKKQLQHTDLKPEQTIESLKEDKEAAGEAVSAVTDDLTPGSA